MVFWKESKISTVILVSKLRCLFGKIDRNESLEIYCVKMLEQKFEKQNSIKYFVNF